MGIEDSLAMALVTQDDVSALAEYRVLMERADSIRASWGADYSPRLESFDDFAEDWGGYAGTLPGFEEWMRLQRRATVVRARIARSVTERIGLCEVVGARGRHMPTGDASGSDHGGWTVY